MHKFRSRVSVLLLTFVLVCILPPLFLGPPNQSSLISYVVLGTSLSLVILLFFGIRYEIDENHLSIKFGPISYFRLPLKEIEKVERSYNPLSSPAASLKRLYVKGRNRDVLISPANESEFVRLLTKRNADIAINIKNQNDWWRVWDWDI